MRERERNKDLDSKVYKTALQSNVLDANALGSSSYQMMERERENREKERTENVSLYENMFFAPSNGER